MNDYIEVVYAASIGDRTTVLEKSRSLKFLTGYEAKVRIVIKTFHFISRSQSSCALATKLDPFIAAASFGSLGHSSHVKGPFITTFLHLAVWLVMI